jgi:uncharacterized protein involved in outer membrane biogenesis
MKKALIGISLILILLLVAGYLFLDHIAKAAIEFGGEQAMGVPTSLENITLRPMLGKGTIEGLEISNPKGFETPFFMNLSKGHAALDMGSLSTDTVVMKTIELDGLKAYLEKTKEGSNYEMILANMKKGEEEGAKGEEPGKKFLVERILVRNIDVRADLAVAGAKMTSVDLRIDQIEIENVGAGKESGVILSQLMGTIVKAVLTAIVQQGAKVLPQVMVNGLGAGLKGVGKVGLNMTVKAGGQTVKVLGGATKDAIKGIGGIFGGGGDGK